MAEINPQNHDVVRIPKTCSYQKYFSNYMEEDINSVWIINVKVLVHVYN